MPSPVLAGRLEAGSFTAHNTNTNPNPVTVNFQQPFDTVPVVIALSDQAGAQSAAIRITNITTNGFDELILEPDNWDGGHAAQNVHYIAVEPGRHVLPDGTIIEAGTASISAVQHGAGVAGPTSWATVNFSAALPSTPSVIAQIQTANSETRNVATQTSRPFITATLQALGTTGFQVALERSEVLNGPIPSAETVGWVAFPAGLSGTFPDTGSTSVTWSTVNSPVNIAGWTNGCFTNGFGQTSATRIVVAKKITRLGGDGGWLRRCSLSSTLIGLRVDEDTARDSERGHINEAASIIAFSQAFHANLRADLNVTKVRFATTGTYGDFNVPGATVEYVITVSNAGNAPPNYDSVILTEELPSELALVVTDFGAVGSGPLQYADGSPATGLTCGFVSLSSLSDCYAFSTDGVDFTYAPTAGPDGTDPAVTHVRVTPAGYMAADTGSGSPNFEIRLRALIE